MPNTSIMLIFGYRLFLDHHPTVFFDHSLGFFPLNVDDFAAIHVLYFYVIITARLLINCYGLRFLVAALLLLLSLLATILLLGIGFKAHVGSIRMLFLGAVHIYFGALFGSLLHLLLVGLHFGNRFPDQGDCFLVDFIKKLLKHLE